MFLKLIERFRAMGCMLQAVLMLLLSFVGIALIAGLLQLGGLVNFLPTAGPTPTPSATATVPSALPGSPTPGPVAPTPTPTGPQSTFFDDTRLLPPEDFQAVARPDGILLVTWTWPEGRDLNPTFFRVTVQGEDHDFQFAGPGSYEEEVPAYCGGTNFLTLDAFNTEVQPEANAQADKVIEIEPDC